MVEREPAVVRQVVPAYPDSARVASVAGWVFARVLVGREGRVKQFDRISGPLVFHQEVAMAAKEWGIHTGGVERLGGKGLGQPTLRLCAGVISRRLVWLGIPFLLIRLL